MLTLLRLEFLKAYRQKSLLFGTLTFCMLLCIAAYVQHQQVERLRNQTQALELAAQERLKTSLDKLKDVEAGKATYPSLWDDPRGYYTWHEVSANMPLPPTAFWAVGQRDLFENVHTLGIFKGAEVAGKAIANPLPMLWGQFDPAFVLVYLMPLFLIGLGFRLIGEETRQGTLPMLLSQPISSRRFFAMKTAVWLLPFLAATCLSLLLCQTFAAGMGSLATWETSVLLGFVTLYATFWLLTTLLLARWCSSTASAALGLVVCWMVLTVILPKTTATFSDRIYPIPSRLLLTGAQREATRDVQAEANKLLAQYYVDHPELADEPDAPVEASLKRFYDYYQKTLTVQREVENQVLPLKEEFYQQRTRQQAFEQTLSYVMPPVLMQQLLNYLAGSSSQDQLHFARYLESFGTQWRNHFQRLAFQKTLISSQNLADMPTFTLPEISHRDRIGNMTLTMAMLNLLLLVGCWLGFADSQFRKDLGARHHD